MKNLAFHKKQVREHRMKNIHERAMTRVDELVAPIFAASDKRWDAMLADLELQRCNLKQRILHREARHYGFNPLFVESLEALNLIHGRY